MKSHFATHIVIVVISGRTNYVNFGHSPYVQTATGWNQVGGIARVPSGNITRFAASQVFFDFSLTVKAAPHECVIRTSPP